MVNVIFLNDKKSYNYVVIGKQVMNYMLTAEPMCYYHFSVFITTSLHMQFTSQ